MQYIDLHLANLFCQAVMMFDSSILKIEEYSFKEDFLNASSREIESGAEARHPSNLFFAISTLFDSFIQKIEE